MSDKIPKKKSKSASYRVTRRERATATPPRLEQIPETANTPPLSPAISAIQQSLSPPGSPKLTPLTPPVSPIAQKLENQSAKVAMDSKEPQSPSVILEHCVAQLYKAIFQDIKLLQRYLFILSMEDPTVIRSTGNLDSHELLGEYLQQSKVCISCLAVIISTQPNILCDQMKQNSAWVMYLFGTLAERVSFYDYFKQIGKEDDSIRYSSDHRSWNSISQQDRFDGMLRFFCKIVRLYAEKASQTFEKCSKQLFEFLGYQLKATNEIMSEEIVLTIQIIINKTEFFAFFVKFLMAATQSIIMEEFTEKELLLAPDDVLRCTSQFNTNIGNILSSIVAFPSVNDEQRKSVITNQLLGMSFFPILLSAAFRASSCKGYMPFLIQLFHNQQLLLKPSHFSAIDGYVERIAKILRHAIQTKSTFGTIRFYSLRLLVSLIRFEQASINTQFIYHQVLNLLLEIMLVSYPNANLFHGIILECFQEIMIKDRRNKNQSIFLLLLEMEKFLPVYELLVHHLDQKQFGVERDVAYVEPARQIFLLLYDSSRVKELLKTQPLLLQQSKIIHKNAKAYQSFLDKSKTTAKKVFATAKRSKSGVNSGGGADVDDEYNIVTQLKKIEDKEDAMPYNSSVVQLKRLFKKSG